MIPIHDTTNNNKILVPRANNAVTSNRQYLHKVPTASLPHSYHTMKSFSSRTLRRFHFHPSPQTSTISRRISQRSRIRRRTPQPKSILFQSLGCPRNFVDTEVMLGLSVQSGLQVTQSVEDADYLVLNTCGFLESARQESRETLEELLKSRKTHSKVIVTGCMVNLHKNEILQNYPAVDSVLGSAAIDKIMETIAELEEGPASTPLIRKSRRRSFLEQGDTPRFLATPPHYAYLKIAEGCKKQCSFCIIPRIKGRLQSKPIPQLVEEYQALLEYGVSEVILIAQDLGDYGKDWSPISKESSHLTDLLRALLGASEAMEHSQDDIWLRLLYLYPDEITPDLVELLKSEPRICPYLDMPIQHSHDDMLKLMRRKTTSEDIQQTIRTLRGSIPGIHIRTSLMVGFPGETDEHFEHLLQFCQEYELDNVGVFTYSNEKLAFSSKLPNHVPENVKEERYHRLMQTQLEIVERRNEERVKKKERLHVVVEGMEEDNIVGRYYGQCPDIDGQVILEGNPRVCAGERYWVELTGYHQYDLIGKVVNGP